MIRKLSLTAALIACALLLIAAVSAQSMRIALDIPAPIVTEDPDDPNLHYFTTGNPTLTWNFVSWAKAHEIQVDENARFVGAIHYSAIVGETDLQHTIPAPPLANGVWYFRVRARDENGVWHAWSAPERFEVDA